MIYKFYLFPVILSLTTLLTFLEDKLTIKDILFLNDNNSQTYLNDFWPINNFNQLFLSQRKYDKKYKQRRHKKVKHYNTHIVVDGDNLRKIANIYNIRERDLIIINNLTESKILNVGQVLRLPHDSITLGDIDFLTGPRVQLPANWIGEQKVPRSMSILIMAGHADSQGIAGAGTAGELVDLKGENPMDPQISDELYWNLKVLEFVVKLGREKGLQISSYDPGIRTIVDENDPRTNWSVGYNHARNGGYALEIHFDAYGKYGFGSGLIPPVSVNLNMVDESLARSFGRYPLLFRGGLGASRRQIRILEVGKLGGELEKKLRDPSSRDAILTQISQRIVDAILKGLYD